MASLRLLRKTIAAGSETSTALPAGLARALTWLRANLNESVHLDQLAQIADVHPRTLEDTFAGSSTPRLMDGYAACGLSALGRS